MEIGMLWYDDSPTALKDRVDQAAGYYTEKYGRKPNLCFVNPSMLQAEEGKAKGVVIRKDKGIMPGHFWIGVDESQIKKNGNRKTPSSGKSHTKSKAEAKSTAPAKTKAKKKPKAKSASAKPRKRTPALLKKRGSRVNTGSKPKSKSKAQVKAQRS
ncbi:MAG: hypothetical protein V3U32_02745 [Anaerolineales bacterium]